MIFGVNGKKLEMTEDQRRIIHNGRANDYSFVSVDQATEAEMFRVFKKKKNIRESISRIDHSNTLSIDEMDDAMMAPMPKQQAGVNPLHQSGNGVKYRPKKRRIVSNPTGKFRHKFPHSGFWIIPKMFGYFPFLDCDDLSSYTEAKFQLCADGIPYVSYKSTKNTDHYWIICDKQGELEETIDFIETYPCDHRYPWIARYKKELCIRAIPKNGYVPHKDDDNLSSDFTDDFAYWNEQFVKYWDSGLIPSYIDMVNTVNAI